MKQFTNNYKVHHMYSLYDKEHKELAEAELTAKEFIKQGCYSVMIEKNGEPLEVFYTDSNKNLLLYKYKKEQ